MRNGDGGHDHGHVAYLCRSVRPTPKVSRWYRLDPPPPLRRLLLASSTSLNCSFKMTMDTPRGAVTCLCVPQLTTSWSFVCAPFCSIAPSPQKLHHPVPHYKPQKYNAARCQLVDEGAILCPLDYSLRHPDPRL